MNNTVVHNDASLITWSQNLPRCYPLRITVLEISQELAYFMIGSHLLNFSLCTPFEKTSIYKSKIVQIAWVVILLILRLDLSKELTVLVFLGSTVAAPE